MKPRTQSPTQKLAKVYASKLLSKSGRINLVGMTFEHWSDRDGGEDLPECRVWQKIGGIAIPSGPTSINLALERAWCWHVVLMAKMRDGTIEQVEIDVKSPLRMAEIDDYFHEQRTALLLEFPDFVAEGWRARITA